MKFLTIADILDFVFLILKVPVFVDINLEFSPRGGLENSEWDRGIALLFH